MRAWVAEQFGRPADVLAIHDDIERPVPGDDDVLVEVEAAAINNNDIDMIYGRWASLPVPAPFVAGAEVVGTVTDSGANARDWIGRRVVGMPRGCHAGFAQYAALPTAMAFEIPAGMPIEQAAGMFWPFHLAWHGLMERGNLKADETVLVHSAAGGAGSAAVQLAVNAGARVIATVGSDAKLDICRELGAIAAINYTTTPDLVKEVLAANAGAGVDVCFDGTGGDLTHLTWSCMAYGGRHVMTGFSSGIEQTDNRGLLMRDPIFGNFSLVGALLTYVDRSDVVESTGMVIKESALNLPSRAHGQKVHDHLVSLITEGKVRTVVDRVIPFEELPDAMNAFERREIAGRVIVRVGE
ncbi:quinone oxidoreductase family protein [Nocardia alni]|uniref:quinone oxidoreductase family protein n=1 Tax=Nocardia alni TaxID=2815723 RepID=UPI001C23809E|nr:zinc-binding dehydrogenase [Nocardia alni]